MNKLTRAWPCALSAILLLFAAPPFNQFWLVFVALIPWVHSLRGLDRRASWRSGYCFGVVYGFGALHWIGALTFEWTHSFWLGGLTWFLATFIFALYFGLTGVLIRKCWAKGWPWLIPIAWVGVEVFRSYIPVFAFPWALLADPLANHQWMIQEAHFGTVYLISAWTMLVNVIGCEWLNARRSSAMKMTACATGLLFVSLICFALPHPSQPFVVSVVQPNVDMAYGDEHTLPERLGVAIQPLLALADKDGSQMALLPEGVGEAKDMPPDMPFDLPQVPFLVGARRGRNPTYESAFGYDHGQWSYADKTRLVVFGEFVPGRDLFPFLAKAFNLPTGDFVAGTEGVRALHLGGQVVGPVICWEEMFPDVSYRQALNGSKVLAVISIDDWFMTSNAPEELRISCIWRSIETGLPIVRSASSGYSLAVDGQGRVIGELPLRVSANLRATLPLYSGSTLFPLLPIFPVLSLLGALVLLLLPAPKKAEAVEIVEDPVLVGQES